MATMVENAQEMIRKAVRVSKRHNIGLVLQIHLPESRTPDDPADPKFTVIMTGEADYAHEFNNPNKVTAFLDDLDAGDTALALEKAQRRQRRQALKAEQAQRDEELSKLDAEFSGED